MQPEHAHQLWQAYFLLPGDCPRAVAEVPDGFGGALKRKWNAEKGRDKRSSGRHAAISKTLGLLWVAHRNECEEDVDVTIVLEKDAASTHTAVGAGSDGDGAGRRRVAVEFDGPHHFIVPVHKAKKLSQYNIIPCGSSNKKLK